MASNKAEDKVKYRSGIDVPAVRDYLKSLPAGETPTFTNIPERITDNSFYMGPGVQGTGGAAIPMTVDEGYSQLWGGASPGPQTARQPAVPGGGALGQGGAATPAGAVPGGIPGGAGRGKQGFNYDKGRRAFANELFQQIGFNPFSFDPITEADASIRAELPQFFKHIFGVDADPRFLTPDQKKYWANSLKELKQERAAELEAKRQRGLAEFRVMMQMFEKDFMPQPVILGGGAVYLPGQAGTRGQVIGGNQQNQQQAAMRAISATYAKFTKNGTEEMSPEGLEMYRSVANAWGYDIDPESLAPVPMSRPMSTPAGGAATAASGAIPAGNAPTGPPRESAGLISTGTAQDSGNNEDMIAIARAELTAQLPPSMYKGTRVADHELGIVFVSDGTKWIQDTPARTAASTVPAGMRELGALPDYEL